MVEMTNGKNKEGREKEREEEKKSGEKWFNNSLQSCGLLSEGKTHY